MNLETKLEPRLWSIVRSNIESSNFTAAILDSIHFLSDVIRERSGLEGDGVALIGAAFGGSNPQLKVNRLQTESEQNIQRGIEAMLRGLYQAIRNPRSHTTHQDNERDADALLIFIDYLLRVVDQSRSPFSLSTFVERVFDPDIVPSERYATLLLEDIPVNKRLATCRELFGRRAESDIGKSRCFFRKLVHELTTEELNELYQLVSEELRQTDDESTSRFVLGAFPPEFWPLFQEIARLRIENKLIRSLRDGKYGNDRCTFGALATWSTNILNYLTLRDELWQVVFEKMSSTDAAAQEYVFTYFVQHIKESFATPPFRLVLRINQGLRAGDLRFKELVESWRIDFPDNLAADHPWRKPFEEDFEQFTPSEPVFASNDLPF